MLRPQCVEASAEPCTRTEMAKCERVGPEEAASIS